MSQFGPDAFDFLRTLAANNQRDWFHAHKADYEAHVRDPFLALIADLAAPLRAISPHFVADPKPLGGSLFRIQRDTRFSNDKSPYKTHAGARFFHVRHKQVEAPLFYLHLEPGACFVAAGLWHPAPPTQRRIRDFLVANPESWREAVHAPAFRKRYRAGGDSLVRAPRGYDPAHPLIEDIKRKDFVVVRDLTDAQMTSPRLPNTVADAFADMAPMVDYLCAALDLEF